MNETQKEQIKEEIQKTVLEIQNSVKQIGYTAATDLSAELIGVGDNKSLDDLQTSVDAYRKMLVHLWKLSETVSMMAAEGMLRVASIEENATPEQLEEITRDMEELIFQMMEQTDHEA